MTKVNSKTD